MKRYFMGSLQCLVAAALITAGPPSSLEAKSYSSGGGRSYSSSRSSSSGGSRSSGSSMSSSRSSGSRSSSSSSRSSSSERSGSTGFTSSSGRSYGSSASSKGDNARSYTSGKSYTSGATKSEPDSSTFSFDSSAARARKEEASRKAFNDYKDSMAKTWNPKGSSTTTEKGGAVPPRIDDARPGPSAGGSGTWSGRGGYVPTRDTIRTRSWRMYDTYAPYYSRPVVVYHDSYNSLFWWWLLDRTLDERAHWAYHHRYDMDPARYQALVADNRELESRVEQLEAQRIPRDTNYVPANMDRDLMYTDTHVSRVYSNRPTAAGAVLFWLLAIPTALGVGAFFVWLIFFKRWQVSTA